MISLDRLQVGGGDIDALDFLVGFRSLFFVFLQ